MSFLKMISVAEIDYGYVKAKKGRPFGTFKPIDTIKTCSMCNSIKPMSEFHNDKTRRDGKCAYCKECKLAYNRNYLFRSLECPA